MKSYLSNSVFVEPIPHYRKIELKSTNISVYNFYAYFTISGTLTYHGMFPSLLYSIQNALNFDILWTSPEDEQWGISDEDGNWNGIVEELRTNRADIATCGLTISAVRESVIDFTVGVINDPITLVKLKPNGEEMNVSAYIYIFTPMAWLLIIIGIFVLAICVFFVSYQLNQKMHSPEDSENFGPVNALGFVLVAMIQQDYTILKDSITSRIISLVTYLFAFLIFAYYSAFLTSLMATQDLPVEIKSFQEVLEQDLDLIMWKSSSYEQIIKDSKPGSAMNKVQYLVKYFINSFTYHYTFIRLIRNSWKT